MHQCFYVFGTIATTEANEPEMVNHPKAELAGSPQLVSGESP